MDSYKQNARREAMFSLAVLDEELVFHEHPILNDVIIDSARLCLSKGEKLVFLFAYGCKHDWQEVWDLYQKTIKSKAEYSSIERYGRTAVKKIGNYIRCSREREKWRNLLLKK